MAEDTSKTLERLNQLLKHLPTQHVELSRSQDSSRHQSLVGKACLVTGGASGLGKAFTQALARRGAYVVILDVDADAGSALESEMLQQRYRVKFIQANVTSWTSQVAALKAAIPCTPQQRIDHFIANAGVPGHVLDKSYMSSKLSDAQRSDTDTPPEPSLGAINVSLIGSYYTMCLASHHFVSSPGWKANTQDDKSIVFLGSMSSYRSMPIGTDYAAAKFGVRGLFTSARETMIMYKLNIRVNMLSPQFIETPMTAVPRAWYERAGYRFCDINDAVLALLRMVEDETVRGRSISINAEGAHDLDDDVSGGDGAVEIQKILRKGLLPTWRY